MNPMTRFFSNGSNAERKRNICKRFFAVLRMTDGPCRMTRHFVFIFSILIFTFQFSVIHSQSTNLSGVYRYKLDNGLELFVAENSAAPLAYVEIAVRAGSVAHTPETAGFFHLYEHMLFKGNAKYANQVEFTEAMNKMGEIDHNGTTSIDRVNYFFTIPSSQVKNGLEFWSYAVRTPKLDEKELENEKKVVLSEIEADFSNPSKICSSGLMRALFPACPWRLDPGGNPDVVRNATVADLKKMQSLFYVPENSAVFVGGDVHHDEIYEYVKEIYGDWKRSENPVPDYGVPSKSPVAKTEKYVFVNPGSSDSIISAGLYLRGPDGESDAGDTYAADVWSNMASNPSGAFAKTFTSEKSLGIPDSDYVGGFYSTRRASGMIGISAAMLSSGDLSPLEKSEKLLSVIDTKLVPMMQDKSRFFDEKTLKTVVGQLEDSRIYELESAEALVSNISSVWASVSADYFFSYDENIARVTEDDVVSFVNKYIAGKNGVFLVTVSPGLWQKYSADFTKAGYKQITAENAFWIKNN